jgi:hypothetical protein
MAQGARAQSGPASGPGTATPGTNGANGVRLGDSMVLHLGLTAAIAYDSNVFFQPINPIQAAELWLTPSFLLLNRPRGGEARSIDFALRGALNYIEYLGADPTVADHRQFGVDAGILAGFFPQLRYNFQIYDNYLRSTQPPYVATSSNYNRDTNDIGVRANLSPGGGRLTLTLGYQFGVDIFENEPLTQYNLLTHTFNVRLSWKFLPKTALFIEATEGIFTYIDPSDGGKVAPANQHPNSYPLHVNAGIKGLITPKLTINVWGGYANGFYATGTNPNTGFGGATLGWKPIATAAGVLGYQHDFVNSLLGSYYDMDEAYISWTQFVWRLTLFARLWYANERYQNIPPGSNINLPPGVDRRDNYVTLNTRVDFPIRPWFVTSAGYDLQYDNTNSMLQTPIAGVASLGYLKHVVYFRLSLLY